MKMSNTTDNPKRWCDLKKGDTVYAVYISAQNKAVELYEAKIREIELSNENYSWFVMDGIVPDRIEIPADRREAPSLVVLYKGLYLFTNHDGAVKQRLHSYNEIILKLRAEMHKFEDNILEWENNRNQTLNLQTNE